MRGPVAMDERHAPCEQDRAEERNIRVRLTPHAELIRDRIAERRAKLDGSCPEAIDLAAAGLAILHDRLNGRLRELSGDHSADYRGLQVRGERSLHLTDIAYLATREPQVVASALSAMLEPLGYRVAASPTTATNIHKENAEFIHAVGRFEAVYARACEDGIIDADESRDLWAALREVLLEGADMVPCLRPTE